MFSSSIAENIGYGLDDPSEMDTEKIVEAAEKANAMGFIESFPNGINTLVGERGQMLSGKAIFFFYIQFFLITLLFIEFFHIFKEKAIYILKRIFERITDITVF